MFGCELYWLKDLHKIIPAAAKLRGGWQLPVVASEITVSKFSRPESHLRAWVIDETIFTDTSM